jgi:hypothetical protein
MVMSDRRDDGPLRLPPEREVTPQLRARVLHQAMREDARPTRTRSRIGPALAGLAAAAVVVGVVYSLSQQGGGDGQTPATGGGYVGQPVGAHATVATLVGAVPDDQVAGIQRRCKQAADVHANYRMTTDRLRGPIGRFAVGAYADKASSLHTQIFCTPFAVLTSLPADNIVTTQNPVGLIGGSRVQGLLPSRNPSEGGSSYYDGAWFAVTKGVKAVEARLVIDGKAQTWHATERTHAYLFASTWAALAADQLSGEITVEYRAISVDDTLMPMPDALTSSTVTPAETRHLSDRRDAFPSNVTD